MSTGMLAESIWLPTASSRGLISIFLCERVPHVHVDMELILNLNILFIKIFTSDNVICMGMFHRFLGLVCLRGRHAHEGGSSLSARSDQKFIRKKKDGKSATVMQPLINYVNIYMCLHFLLRRTGLAFGSDRFFISFSFSLFFFFNISLRYI